jgi:hypothetical protein
MNVRLRNALALLALCGAPVAAQSQWDWVISNFSGGLYGNSLLNFTGNTRVLNLNVPLTAGVGGDASNPIMDPDNNFVYIVAQGDNLLQVFNTPSVTTIAAGLGSAITGVTADEDGTFVVCRSGGILNRVTTAGVVTTITTGLGSPNAVVWDVDTGDYVVANFNAAPGIWRVTRSGVRSTLLAATALFSGIDKHVPSGDFICTVFGALLRVTPGGVATTVVSGGAELASANGLCVLPTGHPDGEYNVAVSDFGSAPTGLYVFDLGTGRVVSTILNFPAGNANGIGPAGVCVNQGKGLHGAGTARGGTLYNLKLRNFSGSFAGKTYVISGSFGARPGFNLADGRLINVALDNLWTLTTLNQLPAIFQNFQGILDGGGDGNGNVLVLPDMALIGLRTFYAFVVLDAGSPGGIQYVSNTHAFTIQP